MWSFFYTVWHPFISFTSALLSPSRTIIVYNCLNLETIDAGRTYLWPFLTMMMIMEDYHSTDAGCHKNHLYRAGERGECARDWRIWSLAFWPIGVLIALSCSLTLLAVSDCWTTVVKRAPLLLLSSLPLS